jgi:hypothetical protein
MKIAVFSLALTTLLSLNSFSQSKVFKEVSNEISSEMKAITQDESLVGYLMFSQLEKADKDSFNYQVSIMDENLNDIGKVSFREKNLELHMVTFGQDVLCLTYLKSDIADLKTTSKKEIKKSVNEGKNYVFTQLINLDGKVIYSGSQAVDLTLKSDISYLKSKKPSSIAGYLKQAINVKNMAGEGFVIFYGDDNKNRLMAIDNSGKQLWEKTIPEAISFNMLTTQNMVYLLSKKKGVMVEGGFGITSFNVKDGVSAEKYDLKDRKGNELKVLGFIIDPASGKPVVSGYIINKMRGNNNTSVRDLSKGPYEGLFTVELAGTKRSEVKEKFTYWSDGAKVYDFSPTGMYEDKVYPKFETTLRDYNGNTYFIGSTYTKKLRVGAIIASVVTIPTVFFPILILAPGTHRCRQTEAMVFKQDSAGKLRYYNSLPGENSIYFTAGAPIDRYDGRGFYNVTNPDTKSSFLIMNDAQTAVIYNVETKKVVRRVPHNNATGYTYIFPAKEGHIMVMEYNFKAKETRLSIEALL